MPHYCKDQSRMINTPSAARFCTQLFACRIPGKKKNFGFGLSWFLPIFKKAIHAGVLFAVGFNTPPLGAVEICIVTDMSVVNPTVQ
jgi:hypothetical protein